MLHCLRKFYTADFNTCAGNLGPPGVIRDLAPSIVDNVLGNTHALKLRGLVDLTNSSVECYCGRSFRLVFCPHMPKLNQKDILKKSFHHISQSKKYAPCFCYDLFGIIKKRILQHLGPGSFSTHPPQPWSWPVRWQWWMSR